VREAVLWSVEERGVRCGVCPHFCLIPEGHTGFCNVRENSAGTLVPLTYARVASVAVDPIEKKPVFHYAPGAQVLSLGSVGCSMRCRHCQNWSISRATPQDEAHQLHDLTPAAAVSLAQEYECPGIAFTYNEPIIQIEYVLDVARLAHESGLFTVMVTNGYITPSALDLLGGLVDVWRVDLKGATDESYKRFCRVPSPEPVREMAVRARFHWGMHVEVVTNVVPAINDSEADLRAMAKWISRDLGPDTPWHVTRFFPYLELSDLDPTPIETLRSAVRIGHEEGLRFVYPGNVDSGDGEDTVCPQCGAVAVRRRGYEVSRVRVLDGVCERCGEPLNIRGWNTPASDADARAR
jgi:pyruvate formate lyase activating enzyme